MKMVKYVKNNYKWYAWIGDDIKLGAFETKKQAEIMAEFYINTFLGGEQGSTGCRSNYCIEQLNEWLLKKSFKLFKCRREFRTSRLMRQGYHSPVNQIVMMQIILIETVRFNTLHMMAINCLTPIIGQLCLLCDYNEITMQTLLQRQYSTAVRFRPPPLKTMSDYNNKRKYKEIDCD